MRNLEGLVTSIVLILTASAVASPRQDSEENSNTEMAGPEIIPPEAPAPVLSDDSTRAFEFEVPAPRGLITDRSGNPLAVTRAAKRFSLKLGMFDESDFDREAPMPVEPIMAFLDSLKARFDFVTVPSETSLRDHWKNRRAIPFAISEPLTPQALAGLDLNQIPPEVVLESIYFRDYPAGPETAHLVGYLKKEMPEQHGPLSEKLMRWPKHLGAGGLEKSLDEELRGQPGRSSEMFDRNGNLANLEVLERPVPGKTIVTSINLPMQRLAFDLLKNSGHSGAMAVVDGVSGDCLALVSYPSFDSAELTRGVSSARYQELSEGSETPFFFRAVSGSYPPGSTFKPIVALTALNRQVVRGISTRFPSPPELEIDGRIFRNWNDEHEGMMDVRYALTRSSNTWFYQAGIYTGGSSLLASAKSFGFGTRPNLPLPSVSAGRLPKNSQLAVRQAVANFSIGQGDLLVSPLQLSLAMGGISNARFLPEARLILQKQDPLTGAVTEDFPVRRQSLFDIRPYDLSLVHAGMWGVVNHEKGTAKAAALELPIVRGKTGTSQWSSQGEEKSLAWFGGFAGSNEAPIAFAVMIEGKPGERLFGGKNAAPIAGEFLKTIFAEPDRFGVKVPPRNRAHPIQQMTQNSTPPAASPSALVNQARRTVGNPPLQNQRNLPSSPVSPQPNRTPNLARPVPGVQSVPAQSMPAELPQLSQSPERSALPQQRQVIRGQGSPYGSDDWRQREPEDPAQWQDVEPSPSFTAPRTREREKKGLLKRIFDVLD